MSPGRWWSAMGSWILWFIGPSIDLHSPAGELRSSHQRALWIRDPRKLLNFLPQSHVVAGYISRSLPYEQVRWVIYSPSPLQTPWGHFSFIVLSIFVKIPVFPGCHSNFLKSHFVFPKSYLDFQRVLVFKFSSYNVWKHVRYPSLISRQPGW